MSVVHTTAILLLLRRDAKKKVDNALNTIGDEEALASPELDAESDVKA